MNNNFTNQCIVSGIGGVVSVRY